MEELKIQINLDPVNDRIIQFPGNKEEIKSDAGNHKAIVLGTDGNFRTIDIDEMDKIITGLGEDSLAEPIGDDYIMCFSEKSVINAEFTRYLVGSVMAMKVGKDSKIQDLTDVDIKVIKTGFQMSLITLACGKEKFQAYPLEDEDAA